MLLMLTWLTWKCETCVDVYATRTTYHNVNN